jgi:hypothetical protein
MAKVTVTKAQLKIVDLIRDRKLFVLLNVPQVPVVVDIEVTTTAVLIQNDPVPSAKMDRLKKAAETKLNEYEKIITDECVKFSKKIDDLQKAGKSREAEVEIATVNHAVKNALASAKGAAEKAVEVALSKEAQGDKLLREARVKTAVTVTFAGIKLATSGARLAGSHGADVTAYISIAKTLVDLAALLNQQLKKEDQLRKDLTAGLKAYIELRKTQVMVAVKSTGLTDVSGAPGFPEVIAWAGKMLVEKAKQLGETGKALTKGKSASDIATDVKNLVIKGVKSQWDDAETARKAYREETTIMRQHVDKISAQADKLFQSAKNTPGLKQGAALMADCMKVKHTVTALAKELDDCVKFLGTVETDMKGMGLDCSDKTIIDKIKELDKSTILSEGAGIRGNIKAIYSLVQAISAAAA